MKKERKEGTQKGRVSAGGGEERRGGDKVEREKRKREKEREKEERTKILKEENAQCGAGWIRHGRNISII